jgi:hypothetical protein
MTQIYVGDNPLDFKHVSPERSFSLLLVPCKVNNLVEVICVAASKSSLVKETI